MAFIYLIKKALKIPVTISVTSIEPRPLYKTDNILGYTTKPGQYKGGFSADGKTYLFNFTVPSEGLRSTAYMETLSDRSIYVFGDSFILGWGNSDEQTMPWLLQERLPNFRVYNYAQNGYGNTHAVLQFKKIESYSRSEDIIVLSYGDYYLVRNFGAPSFIRLLSNGVEHRLSGKDGFENVRYPIARTGPGGTLAIEYVTLFCGNNNGYCDGPEPRKSSMIDSTISILKYFSTVKPHVVVAFISGADDDPVIRYARQLNFPIADLRPDRTMREWDDFGELDRHPAQIAQYSYYQKLLATLMQSKLVSLPARQ